MKLKNKIALITGSSSGIGQGIAKLFAQEGATVVVNYPSEKETDNADSTLELITSDSPDSITHMANVSVENEVIEMIDSIKDRFGTIDILVNNAGIATSAPIHEMTSQMWNELLSIHLSGTFMCTRECLKIMYKNNYG
ncbi:MAG: SDR family NAD(P)-dependent oxidoreductase, partial [Gammaproteobacteria bacterium]|nr:SDR family NAD(P)-dependent oxidoreductase [Gammaproteobacteria bacterium]